MKSALPVYLFAAILMTACPTSPVTNSPGNNGSNTNSTPLPTVTATPTPGAEVTAETGSLSTPTEAYKTAFTLRQKRDAQGLKKALSKEILEFFTEMGKLEKKSLDEMIKDLAEKPQAGAPETRNEKIDGDRAMLEFKDDKGEWQQMDFVKEDGGWKLTLPKADASVQATPKKH